MAKEFTYDLERMKKALEGPFYTMPSHIKTAEEFRDWIHSINLETEDDDNESSSGNG